MRKDLRKTLVLDLPSLPRGRMPVTGAVITWAQTAAQSGCTNRTAAGRQGGHISHHLPPCSTSHF